MKTFVSVGTGRLTRRDRLQKAFDLKLEELKPIQRALEREEAKVSGRSLDSPEFEGARASLIDPQSDGHAAAETVDLEQQAMPAENPNSLRDFLRVILSEGGKGRLFPTPYQSAVSWVAFCWQKQMPYIQRYSMDAAAKDLGCSLTLFHRHVHRWAVYLGEPVPHSRPQRRVISKANDASCYQEPVVVKSACLKPYPGKEAA